MENIVENTVPSIFSNIREWKCAGRLHRVFRANKCELEIIFFIHCKRQSQSHGFSANLLNSSYKFKPQIANILLFSTIK